MIKYIQPDIELIKKYLMRYTDFELSSYNFRKENTNLQKNSEGITGFKSYKIDARKSGFDCDKTKLTMSIWCVLLGMGKNVREVIGYNGRTIKYIDISGNEIIVETDTINSLDTELNEYLRKLVQKYYNCSIYDLYSKGGLLTLNGSEVIYNFYPMDFRIQSLNNRDYWIINNYETLMYNSNLFVNEQKDLFSFNSFANLTHTLGNFMIGPLGFNCKSTNAKSKYSDRLDLFLEDILFNNKSKEWSDWFKSNLDVLFIDKYFTSSGSLLNLRHGEVSDWLNLLECLILERGILLSRKLRAALL